MQVKKCMALLLTGMLSVSALSGCNRTIIEHQFHTNTETNTEYITEIIESGSPIEIQNLEKLLNEHGIKLIITINNMQSFPQDAQGDINNISITQDDFVNWLDKPSVEYCLYKEFDPSTKALDFVNGLLNHTNMIYQAFLQLTDEQWSKLSNIETLYVIGVFVQNNNNLYLETAFSSDPYH
ncbi:hypothetical protein B5G12_05440 [Faecalibacterium sp. An58]|uniref:hypothetical protein n=1 Tax=Faecalibacterium sp. An58 TaxID=1965648 RepID=UPI000B3A8224|nr:hypothetical protein [Faecalibacterium sp. An58]OUN74578.1 hypothetical protein B5G12_05440 [Faecalibacterium sp. An58]